MNTMFLSKTISPRMSSMSGPVESWLYGMFNAALIGGATAASSWAGLNAAHSAGLDVPALNLKGMGVVFISGALMKLLAYWSQGLPQLKQNDATEQISSGASGKPDVDNPSLTP